MKRLSLYIALQYLMLTFFVTLTVTAAVWVSQILRFFQMVVAKAQNLSLILKPAILMIPDLVSLVLPITLFISALFLMNKLTNDREIIILKSSGWSNLQIASPILGIVIGIVIILQTAGYSYLPGTFRSLKDIEKDIRNNISGIALTEGSFNMLPGGATVYIRKKSKTDGSMKGIFVHVAQENRKPFMATAERGTVIDTPSGPNIILYNGARHERDPVTGKISVFYFDQATRELFNKKSDKPKRSYKPHEMSMPELWEVIKTPTDSLYYRAHLSEFHQRIIGPVYALVYVMVTMLILLSGDFNRRAGSGRVVLAVVSSLIMLAISMGLQNLIKTNSSFLFLMYLFPITILALATYAFATENKKFVDFLGRVS